MSGSGVYYTAGQLASMGTAITQAQTALQQAQASPTSANISAVTAALNNYYGVQINNPTNGAVMRGYAELAQSVVTNTGVGIVANQEVQNAVGQATYTSLYQANLALQLAVADQSVITNNGGQVPTLADVAEYHASVFTDFNIPVAAWGGAAYTALGEDYTLGAATSAELSSIQPANPSYSAHSRDSETTIVQRIEFLHRSGVTTALSTRSPRVSQWPLPLLPKTRGPSTFPLLNARRWWRRLTADASPPTVVSCCSAPSSGNSVSSIRLRR